MTKWYVYIVECSDGTLYTGTSNDVNKRVLTHNKGKGAKYTRVRLPVLLKGTWECENRSEACKLESKMKKLSKKEKIAKIHDISLTGYTFTNRPQYKVNVDSVKSIDDVKLILKFLNLHFTPPDNESYNEIKHLLILD